MTTKERIVAESLALFSQSGYEAVTMIEIAKKVGIKDASIYAHFKSKQDILNAIFDAHIKKLGEIFGSVISYESIKDVDMESMYKNTEENVVTDMILKAYIPFLTDTYLIQFRRLLTVEQYRNERAAKAYRDTFLNEPVRYNAALFSHFVEKGLFVLCDVEAAARQFFAPMLHLMYSGDHELYTTDEIVELVTIHVKQFNQLYTRTRED